MKTWIIAAALPAAIVCAASAAQAQPGAALRKACEADFRSLCSGVQPGGGRILACLKDQRDKLSPNCKDALAAAGK